MNTEETKPTARERWGEGTEWVVAPGRRVPAAGSAPGEPMQDEESEETTGRNRALLRVISDFVFYVRKDGVVLEAHGSGVKDLVLPLEQVVGKRLKELLPSQMAQQATHYMEKALRSGAVQVVQGQFALPGGLRDFEVRLAPVSKEEVVALAHDVSDRRLMQKEILEVSQRERTRIGQDLHDGLGQHLTGITFLTRALQNKLEARQVPEAQEAGEIGRLVMQALSQTRNLARGLFPVEIAGDGLVPAFKELAGTVEKLFQITCRVECDADWSVASESVATHVFRLAQEAISNSVKHGKAKRW